jgi:uroporphyrinogen-III synthase
VTRVRVLISRPRPGAERSAARLAALGHEALVAPLLTIEATGEPAPAGRFDALLLTSANAAAALTRWGHLAALPTFAVGERTAALAHEAGQREVHTAEADGVALAALVRRSVAPGGALLHAAGRERKLEPEASLTAAGYGIVPWIVYAAVGATRLPDVLAGALANGHLQAALHYSRRSVEIALSLTEGTDLLRPLLDLAHHCLSEDVAQPLAMRGATRLCIAERPDEESLLATLPAPLSSRDGSPMTPPRC